MFVPQWVTFLVAAMVVTFGLYRLNLARRSDDADERARKRGGLYALPRRTHLLVGLLYLIMGVFLTAAALGVKLSPF